MFNATKIRELRRRFKIKQSVIAELLGIDRSTYVRREKKDLFYAPELVQIINFFQGYLPQEEYTEIIRNEFNAAKYEPEPESVEPGMVDMYNALLKEIWKLQEKVDVCCAEIKLLKKAWGREPKDNANDVAM